MKEKIQKILSNFGYGSRRIIEKKIEEGKILIDGKKVIIGQRVEKKHLGNILFEDKLIYIPKFKKRLKILVYNKPEGEICTRKDNYKRPTVFEKLPYLKNDRWISVGRLDCNTRGLLLFTNDGLVAYNLMHPKNQIEREYYIRIFGNINMQKIEILKKGIYIEGNFFIFKSICIINNIKDKKNIWLKGILCEGKNREIRKIFKYLDCQVNRLIRIRYGNIFLPKTLQLGNWIQLNSTFLKNISIRK